MEPEGLGPYFCAGLFFFSACALGRGMVVAQGIAAVLLSRLFFPRCMCVCATVMAVFAVAGSRTGARTNSSLSLVYVCMLATAVSVSARSSVGARGVGAGAW